LEKAMAGQEDHTPASPNPPVAHPEKVLSPPANHRDSTRDLDVFGKDNDFGEKPEDSDLEAQEELAVDELPSDERDRDVALSGGIEGRPLSILSRVKSGLSTVKSRPDSLDMSRVMLAAR
jgi:hypothetical protein